MTKANCANCRFYFFGFCRRYPPTVFINPIPENEEEQETVSEWPAVEAEDWCGEYQDRTKPGARP